MLFQSVSTRCSLKIRKIEKKKNKVTRRSFHFVTNEFIGRCNTLRYSTQAFTVFWTFSKIIIAMETGLIPPNLHFKSPMKGIKCFEEGKVRVVTEPTPWQGGYIGINSFGFGGANAHVLLKSHTKEKINNGAPSDDLPRLVAVSGRTLEGVECLLNDVGNLYEIARIYDINC